MNVHDLLVQYAPVTVISALSAGLVLGLSQLLWRGSRSVGSGHQETHRGVPNSLTGVTKEAPVEKTEKAKQKRRCTPGARLQTNGEPIEVLVDQVLDMRADRKSFRLIATETGMSHVTARAIVQRGRRVPHLHPMIDRWHQRNPERNVRIKLRAHQA